MINLKRKKNITLITFGVMFLLVIATSAIFGIYKYSSFKLQEIKGTVIKIVWVSDFHAKPEITIKNEIGKTWVLHRLKFKGMDIKVGYSFIKKSGSTLGYINGRPVNLGW